MKLKRTPILIVLFFLLVVFDATANDPNVLAQFDTLTQNVALLPVTIAGTEHLFILDTGFTVTAFDKHLRNYLGKEKRDVSLATHDTLMQLNLYDAPESFVGQMKMGCEEVLCSNLTLFSLIVGKKIGGVVGMDFLKHHIIQLDYEQGKVFFFKSKTNLKSEWGQEFDMKFFSKAPYLTDVPYIDLTVLDDIEIEFMIDTGSNSSISLVSNNFKKIMAKGEMNTTKGISATLSGILEKNSLRYKNFSIEPFESHNIIIDSNPSHNLIGTIYLSRYIVTFDFPNSKVYLKEGKYFNKVDEVDMSGLHILLISNNVVVHSVDDGSPSSKAGIQANDIILKVNDKDANTYGMYELRDLLKSGDKHKISMTIKRDDDIKEVSFLLKRTI